MWIRKLSTQYSFKVMGNKDIKQGIPYPKPDKTPVV
jgi:hypothetical protein